MPVEFEFQISDDDRLAQAERVVQFVSSTASYSTGFVDEGIFSDTEYPALSQQIESRDFKKIIVKDLADRGMSSSTPGLVELLDNDVGSQTFIISLNFDKGWPRRENDFLPMSVEEVLFHELSHVGLEPKRKLC